MAKNDVTVVDQYGNLLSRPPQDSAGMVSDAQLEHRIRLEEIYRNRVIALVSPIVGAGNVTAQVNLAIDFTSEITEELMDPEGTHFVANSVVQVFFGTYAKGVPGATITARRRRLISKRSRLLIIVTQMLRRHVQQVRPEITK